MDLTFLIILFFVFVIFIFLFMRIFAKSTIWSSLIVALVWSLIIILLIQAVVPSSYFDNRYSIGGIMIIIWIVLIFSVIYITDMGIRDTDLCALAITDRNVILY